MEMHKLIDSSPNSSNFNDQHPDPNDYVNQSEVHKVSFAFNRLKIDENEPNKQQSIPESDEKVENDDYVDQSAAHEVSFAFNHLKIDENERKSTPESDEKGENDDDDEVSFAFNRLKIDENESNKQQSIPELPETDENQSHKQQLTPESPENDDENGENDDDYEEDEGEFTFMCIGDDNNDSPTSSDVFENGQIRRHRQAFPLFDQSLLLSGGDSDGERRRLPIHVPVDKVFIESPRRGSPSSTGYKSTAGGASSSATLCALPTESETGGGAPEMNMKSNSTGFSKLWRFRDKMNRSNSDGRDAFVFLEPSRTTTTSSSKTTSSSVSIGKTNGGDEFDSTEKVNGVKKGGVKGKKLTASAHEVYLKQKRGEGQTEDERRRRRSYLPYRPGLMGFFTNVNGGLSKNVHPF